MTSARVSRARTFAAAGDRLASRDGRSPAALVTIVNGSKALSGPIAEIRRNGVGVVNDHIREGLGAFQINPACRATDAQRRKNTAGLITDRRANTAKAVLMLCVVDRIASPMDAGQLDLQFLGVGDGIFRVALEAHRHQASDNCFWLKGKNCLANACAMRRRGLNKGRWHRPFGGRIGPVNDDGLMPVKHGKMDDVTTETRERFYERTCFSMQIHVCKNDIAEFEELEPQTISIALAILIEQPHLLHRR